MTRVLFVTQTPPVPPNAGDRQRTQLLLRALRQVAQVDVVLTVRSNSSPLRDEALADRWGVVAILHQTPRGARGAWRWFRPLMPRLLDRLAHNLGSRRVDYSPDPAVAPAVHSLLESGSYDAAVGRYLLPSVRSGLLAQSHVPVVVDVDDLDTEVYRSRLNSGRDKGWRRMIVRRHLNQLEAIVPDQLKRSAHLWLASPTDQVLVGSDCSSILPNIPFPSEGQGQSHATPLPKVPIALTVASMTHGINVLGIDRFVAHLWPEIVARVPEARYRIVGSGMNDELRARWGKVEGVEPIGYVNDLSAAYAESALTVVPMFEGGGTKIKVLEALRHGRTVVTTKHGNRGYDEVLRHGESLWVATDDSSFVDGCCALLAEPSRAAEMAAVGRRLVEKHFCWQRFAQQVDETLTVVLSKGRAG